ncbi:MAG: insulinase family protein [Bacteroidetes bacterium]|nr:insulinase family protein [Bacteroidota bacterium]
MQKFKTLCNGLFLLVISLLFSVSVFSQFKGTDNLPLDASVKKGKLPNGLTYYIRKNAKPENKVQLRLVVNAGSVLEDPDQLGLAHMMEHMNFNGSKNFPKNDLVSYLQSIGVQFGADLNANTGFDATIYILPIPSDDPEKLDKGFTILEDWAGNALLDSVEINKERGVVLEESRLGKGANERMGKKYLPKLFNGSKYASRIPIGKDEIIQNFKPATIKRFYKTWYRPDNMAVIVVGDIDPVAAEKEIIKHFSNFKNPVPEKPRPAFIPVAPRTTSEAMVLTDKEQTIKLLNIFDYIEKDKAVKTWGDYRSTIIENLFTTMVNQRLSELTQQANPPFLFAGTGTEDIIRGYKLHISVAALSDKPVQVAIDSLVRTTETVKKFGFLPAELERAKSNLLNEMQNAYENKDKTESANLVEEYIGNFLSGEPIPGISNEYEYMKQVVPGITLQEVNALTAKMDSKQGEFLLLRAPDKEAGSLPSSQQALAMLNSAHQLPIVPYAEKAVAKSLLDKMPVPGKVINTTNNADLGITELTFSNGITVTLKPTEFKNDEIKMDAWRWGGFHNYEIADKQNAEYCAQLVGAMGVKDMSPVDLQKFLAGKTVGASSYVNPNDEGIEGSCSAKDLETFLQLVNVYFTQPRKDEKLFQSFVTSQKTFLQNIRSNPFAYFGDTLSKIEYGNNPWAQGIPSPADFDKINLDRSFNIYKEIFGNAYGIHFTLVGNIDVEKITPLLETYLGSLPSTKKENKFTDVGLRPAKGIIEATVYKGADKKSLVNLIFTGEAPYSRDEELKLKALIEVLNIKTIERLREEMGGIYTGGSRAGFEKRPYNHYTITTSFPCGPENVDKLIAALFDIIKNAREKGVEQKDLDKVKETWKRQNQDHIKQNDYWLNSLSTSWIDQENPAWIQDYAKKVDSLTTKDLQDAAVKYFNMQNYIKAVLKPEK